MKLQRTTLILLLLALGLGGFVYFYEIQGATQRQEAKNQEQQIFSFEEKQVKSFTVKTKGQTLEFEREEKAGKSTWQMKAPSDTPANDASVAYLLDLLVGGKSDRTIQVPATQLQEYGLDQPRATIEVKLNNQETHQLILGKPDFNRNFLYAQAVPPAKLAENVEVLLVSTDFANAVNRSLSEWKSQDASKSDNEKSAEAPKESFKATPSP
ncbi:DUF4340 domain-containing protein [Chroococcidiopsis sp. CCMEE 29]|uniref:DUF4340 domain-containing protein n=1 Tax=Chroococcidiopsis sp. CCMEE 29 TaxID=155894 RepID=UPI00202178D9|nr:DUF4340 domain-containing protein [Chroococcidiopsis sp. CCMEE 29]